MTTGQLRNFQDVLADQLTDAAVRVEWEAKTPARVIALRLVKFRTEKGLSQTQLGRVLGMSQPAIARLESGEHVPTLPMLLRIAEALEIEILIDIRPEAHEAFWVAEIAETSASISERILLKSGQEYLVAAS